VFFGTQPEEGPDMYEIQYYLSVLPEKFQDRN
jgi:hypothetical protein